MQWVSQDLRGLPARSLLTNPVFHLIFAPRLFIAHSLF